MARSKREGERTKREPQLQMLKNFKRKAEPLVVEAQRSDHITNGLRGRVKKGEVLHQKQQGAQRCWKGLQAVKHYKRKEKSQV